MSGLKYIWNLSRTSKRAIGLFVDTLFIVASYYGAYWARLGESGLQTTSANFYILSGTVAVTLISFSRLGLYRAVLRYLTFHALYVVSGGAAISTLSIVVLSYLFTEDLPRSVPVIYGAFLTLTCGGSRLIVRGLVNQSYSKDKKNVLIYGAGAAGRQLALALRSSDTHKVRGFIDQDATLCDTIILGLRVLDIKQATKPVKKHEINQILLAIPSATRSHRKKILDELVPLAAKVLTVPDMSDILSGKAKIDELKDVAIADLLGRDPVAPQQSLMEANVKGKVVMVTGAGGSIGSELCRQIVKQKPKTLVLYELSEFAVYRIERELTQLVEQESLNLEIVPLLGSVQQVNLSARAMKSFGVETVYHAAAYKHVPLVEYNVIESVRNNVFGTYYMAKAAIEAKVESFVLVSTDKAVRPTNVMGATKRMAELALQALSKEKDHQTSFCMVRFGNVLGSSGSVIPLFKKQIEQGGPVTITHPDITRYFMTIPEAAQLVIQAGAMAKGGDVFVLDMGESVRIADLAENLIHLSGLEVKSQDNPYGDIELKYSGLRPGEKLYEELIIGDDAEETAHERIMTASEESLSYKEFNQVLENLEKACHNFEHETIRKILLETPTGFNPSDDIGDLIWKRTKVTEETS